MDITSRINGLSSLAQNRTLGEVASSSVNTSHSSIQSGANHRLDITADSARLSNAASGRLSVAAELSSVVNELSSSSQGANGSSANVISTSPDVTYQNLNPSNLARSSFNPTSSDDVASVSGDGAKTNNNAVNNTDDNQQVAQSQDKAEAREQARQQTQEDAELALIQKQITQLAARDREVRAHEQAHMAAGGQYAGAASYTYERGPDGVNYAVGGEVPIDVSPAATPAQTIEKAQVVKRAALAPAEPSPQDRKVASLASAMEQQARAELLQEQNTSRLDDNTDNTISNENIDLAKSELNARGLNNSELNARELNNSGLIKSANTAGEDRSVDSSSVVNSSVVNSSVVEPLLNQQISNQQTPTINRANNNAITTLAAIQSISPASSSLSVLA